MEQLEIGFSAEDTKAPTPQAMIDALEAGGEYRVLRRLNPVESYHSGEGEKKIAIYLDTETTGFDAKKEKIIEIAMVPFEYDAEGRIYRVLPALNALQDPGFPIPPHITQITHITDEMVKGQAIDWQAVEDMLATANLVIAHNAGFDRPFVEGQSEGFKKIAWACSINDINWNEEGMEGVKLEYLGFKYGFFYEGHRATVDCYAGIEILAQRLPASGEPVLKRLLDNSATVMARLWAERAPFEKKDKLKSRGYRWSTGENDMRKAWYCEIPESELDAEMAFLQEQIYGGKLPRLPVDRVTALERYARR
ncbi:MAG: 3'-5' exonuclease [Gammaproteobacteria bacterium]|nr:3'-5' exonuclease [Gammaproteobacteria bacterium]